MNGRRDSAVGGVFRRNGRTPGNGREAGAWTAADRVVSRVVIKVEEGIAHVVEKPVGVEVVIVDYDPDAKDPVWLSGEPPERRIDLSPEDEELMRDGEGS